MKHKRKSNSSGSHLFINFLKSKIWHPFEHINQVEKYLVLTFHLKMLRFFVWMRPMIDILLFSKALQHLTVALKSFIAKNSIIL